MNVWPALFFGVSLVGLAEGGACAETKQAAALPQELRVKVVRSFPHDRSAFTQGLVFHEGKLYESTGLLGRSSLRRVDPESGKVEAQVALEPSLFAEGLARVGGRLYQLTWQNGRVLVWNLATLAKVAEFRYEGEGWGLCYDGRRLVMSDGSDRLSFRDPQSFAKIGEVAVRHTGRPVLHLNELECVDGLVYANIWQQQRIARIDLGSGAVTGWIDASGLLTREEAGTVDVLNGIAYLPSTGRLLLTGKLWPRAFEVEFVPASPGAHKPK